jgi:acetylornithine deacetylase/succinyl-diaminopimelate desuccinylase-like protein
VRAACAHWRGDTIHTIRYIPYIAMQANLSVRYVPNQTADNLIGHLQRHLKHEFHKLRSRNTIEFGIYSRGQSWNADRSSSFFKLASDTIALEWGVKPLMVREGGTMPCASMLESMLDAPVIMVPMGQSSDNCHLANERIRKENLIKGKNVMRRIVEGME